MTDGWLRRQIAEANRQVRRIPWLRRSACSGTDCTAPHQLWKQAEGDHDKYVALMIEHGHLVVAEPTEEAGNGG